MFFCKWPDLLTNKIKLIICVEMKYRDHRGKRDFFFLNIKGPEMDGVK